MPKFASWLGAKAKEAVVEGSRDLVKDFHKGREDAAAVFTRMTLDGPSLSGAARVQAEFGGAEAGADVTLTQVNQTYVGGDQTVAGGDIHWGERNPAQAMYGPQTEAQPEPERQLQAGD